MQISHSNGPDKRDAAMDPKSHTAPVPDSDSNTVLPVIQESVKIYKTVVDNGGVRIRKQVHSELVEIDEPLATEAVKVTRVPIGREVEGPVAIRYEDGVTIIPVVEERLIIRRQLLLVEEVHVGRTSYIRRTPQAVTVRREEITVERQKPGDTEWRIDSDASNSS
jgi:uncharacterized protein (TIGR02271 family)